jgi:hypothetical protein
MILVVELPTQIIGLTSLLSIICSIGAKGSTQTNKRNKLGFKRKEQKQTEGCPGLAHRIVRCTREIHSKLLSFEFLEMPLRYNSPDCSV